LIKPHARSAKEFPAMAKAPDYVILGRGRWAQRMRPIISGEGKNVVSVEQTRQHPSENESDYLQRLVAAMKASRAQIAWLCVSPGPHVSSMIQAAIEAGLHVIVEKPWYGSSKQTQRLQSLARAKGRVIAVHFEYLVLKEVEQWKADFHPGTECSFGGRFFLSRSDRSGIPPIDNLGCHLLAIREYTVPSSEVSVIRCDYELPDERLVWIDVGGQPVSSIDLLAHRQPIIQRFMQKVEAALDGAAFPFDLEFALRVAVQLNSYKSTDPAK
jgi:predicted dehydrogenase